MAVARQAKGLPELLVEQGILKPEQVQAAQAQAAKQGVSLKQDTRYQKIPIVMFSAKAQEKDEQLGLS